MPRSVRAALAFVAFVVLLHSSAANGQVNAKPKHLKPGQLLAEAKSNNGLSQATGAPWHIRARYRTFDEQGIQTGDGTFEEWWFGPKSYKIAYAGAALNQTDIATDAGLFRTGDQRWSSWQEYLVDILLKDPISFYPYDPRKYYLAEEPNEIGGVKLRCLYQVRKESANSAYRPNLAVVLSRSPAFCFEGLSSELRFATSGWDGKTVLLNDEEIFQGRSVAGNVQVMRKGKDFLKIKVESIDTLPPDAARPSPAPGNSGPISGRIVLEGGRAPLIVDGELSLGGVAHSLGAAEATVKIVIGKDGHVLSSSPLSGNADLAAAIIASLPGITFEPFNILGAPVEVETIFTLQIGSVITSVSSFSTSGR